MKHWINFLFGLFTISCNSQSSFITESEFTKVYMDSLKIVFPTVNFEIVSDLTINAESNSHDYTHFLDNAYKDYKLQPDSLTQIIAKYINSSIDIYNEPSEINVNRIVPIIKPLDFLNEIQNLNSDGVKEDELQIYYEKYNDELIIVYGEDTEKNIRYIIKDDIINLEIDKDTLFDFAINNLNSILPEIQRFGENGSYGIAAGGYFEASIILMSNIWTTENFSVDGDFVIAIPNRDLLFVTGSKNKAEIKRIRKIALDSYETGTYQISPFLFKFDGKKFVKY